MYIHITFQKLPLISESTRSDFKTFIYGNLNVNFLTDSNLDLQITLLPQSYSMFHIIDFLPELPKILVQQ